MTIEERILEIERRLEDMKRQSQAALALATACVETLERVREPCFSWGGSSSLEQRRAATEESSATEPAQRHPIKPRIGVLNASIKASMDRIQAFVADLPEPAPAPAADRPLWEVMVQARYNSDGPRMGSVRLATAAEIDAVADWLDARGCHGAAHDLRIEARRAREGA